MIMPILYKRASDGGISVCTPVISIDDPEGFTTEDAYARAYAKDIPHDALEVTRINHGDIDLTDVFRDAWASMNPDKTFIYHAQKAKDIVDQKLQDEMRGYVDKSNLLTKMGRDTAGVQASIADCRSRVSQLDNSTIPKFTDAATLNTLKSLIN